MSDWNKPNRYWSDEECNKRTIVELKARIEELEAEIHRYEAGYQWWLEKCQGLEDELARRVKEVSEIAADRETRLGKHQIRIKELEAQADKDLDLHQGTGEKSE